MRDRRSIGGWVAAWGTLALLCGASVGGLGAEEKKAPEPLETELIRVRYSIINASSKLKNDVGGISPGDAGTPSTPGRSCCSSNLEHIEGAIRESARILEAFDRCYEEAGNTDMVLLSRVTRSDLATFARTLPGFADARTKREAQAALDAMSRTYNLLRDTAVGLATCGDVARPPAPPPDPKPVPGK